MVNGERTVGLASAVAPQAGLDLNKKCESAPLVTAGASPQISKAILEFKNVVYVRYYDHVLFNRSSAMLMTPVVREAVGWLVYECDQYITLVLDRDARPPTLKGNSDPKATGLVILASDIAEFKRLKEVLDFTRSLNYPFGSLQNREVTHQTKEAKNSQDRKSRKGSKNDVKTRA